MIRICIAFLLLLGAAGAAGAQQPTGAAEIVVTAMKRTGVPEAPVPAIGLRRVADFAVQAVTITGDTRDPARRHDEIFAMIKGAIQLAQQRGDIELATGTLVVEPLTLANYRNLTLKDGDRADSEEATFLIKTRLAGGADAKAALERIDAFIKAVPAVGRAELQHQGELTLSVVAPDQYRVAIIDLVAADARTTAGKLGPDYAVEAKGLDRPVEWTRASLTEVFLYLPYSYSVVPKPR